MLVFATSSFSGTAEGPIDRGQAVELGHPHAWLVAQGLAAPELLDAAEVRLHTLDVASGESVMVGFDGEVPTVVPAVAPPFCVTVPNSPLPSTCPPRLRSCAGPLGTTGTVRDPLDLAPAPGSCDFAGLHGIPVWGTTLTCGAPAGTSTCFTVGVNVLFFGFGLFEIFCQPAGPAGAGLVVHGTMTKAQTVNCTSFTFGENPSTWTFWTAFCGGTGGPGEWACGWVLR